MGNQSNPTNGMQTAFAIAGAASPATRDLFNMAAGWIEPPEKTGKAGRPAGARNRRTEAYAELLIAMHGDPLQQGVRIAAIDILQPGALRALAGTLGVSTKEALAFYKDTRAQVLPYLHQQQARAVVVRPGQPENPIDAAEAFPGLVDLVADEPPAAERSADA